MAARENLKPDIPDFSYLWMQFIENEGKKMLPPKESLMLLRWKISPHPPL